MPFALSAKQIFMGDGSNKGCAIRTDPNTEYNAVHKVVEEECIVFFI